MTKDIILTISGIHDHGEGAAGPIERILPGQYYLKNGKHYVIYDEPIEGSDGKTKSTLKFADNQVELIRNGAAAAYMVFQKEQEHRTVYQTPMGALIFSVYTEDMVADIGEDCMNLEIHYFLKAQEQIVSESTLRLQVRSEEKGLT